MKNDNGKPTVMFRRIRGRIIPIRMPAGIALGHHEHGITAGAASSGQRVINRAIKGAAVGAATVGYAGAVFSLVNAMQGGGRPSVARISNWAYKGALAVGAANAVLGTGGEKSPNIGIPEAIGLAFATRGAYSANRVFAANIVKNAPKLRTRYRIEKDFQRMMNAKGKASQWWKIWKD